jgi:hypothetical protein
MLFDGFDDIYYDWAQYNCGMGVCCDPYAVGLFFQKIIMMIIYSN